MLVSLRQGVDIVYITSLWYVDADNIIAAGNAEEQMMIIRKHVQRLWQASRPLTATGVLMLAAFAASLAAMAVSDSNILGMPAWLKPAKFAISTAVYALTLAWIFTHLPAPSRLTKVVGWVTSVVVVLEVAIIDLQAARGVTSHFNVATPLDAVLFSIMGTGILIAWFAAIALTVALFRQRFSDEAFGWALRLGLMITVLGQATGGLMTSPTAAQLAAAKTARLTVAGAHTVGAADGGPGVPITGWSRDHGDLRVPHFVGLHAVQALPLAFWLIAPLGSAIRRRRAIVVVAAAYGALFAILLAQALNGQSFLDLHGGMAIAFGAWAAALMLGSMFVLAAPIDDANRGAVPAMVSR
jgi:hypothetical protein